MNANHNNHRSPIQHLTVNFSFEDHQVTAIPMTDHDLTAAAEDIELLDLPEDRTGLMALKGFNLYNTAGEHFGRIVARGGVMTAEWYDNAQQDWALAQWNCHRLERGIIEILRLREETLRPLIKAAEARAEQWHRAEYAAYLERHNLALDEDGEEIPAAAQRAAHRIPVLAGATA